MVHTKEWLGYTCRQPFYMPSLGIGQMVDVPISNTILVPFSSTLSDLCGGEIFGEQD